MQAHLKVQICSSTLAVKLYSRSVASLTVKLCCRSVATSTLAAKQKSGEYSKLRPHSKLPIVEASTRSSGSKLRYTHSFSYFRRNRSTVLANLRRADVSVTSPGCHCRENGVKSCSNGALTSPLGEVNAPFETQVSIDSGIAHFTSLESAVQVAN